MIASCGTVHYQLNSSQHNCIQYADYNLQLYHEFKADTHLSWACVKVNVINSTEYNIYRLSIKHNVWIRLNRDLPGKCYIYSSENETLSY